MNDIRGQTSAACKMRRTLDAIALSGLLVLLAACPGCTGWPPACSEQSYDEVVAACGNPDAGQVAALLEEEGKVEVSEECIDALGEQYCVQWNEFGGRPEPFSSPWNFAESLVFALLSIVDPTRQAASLEWWDNAPSELSSVAQAHADELGVSLDELGVGEFMFTFMTDRISAIYYDEELSVLGSYYEDGSVILGDLDAMLGGEDSGPVIEARPYPVQFVAILLVHEVGHDLYPGHQGCQEGAPQGCDPTMEGANGVSAFWGRTWLELHLEELDEQDCSRLAAWIFVRACLSIESFEDWPVCDPDELFQACDE